MITTLIEEMYLPRVRSPEELREFYTIVLRAKSEIHERHLPRGIAERAVAGYDYDAHSMLSRGSASTACSQNQSCSSASLFSAQAQTASSATSISEDSESATLTTCQRIVRSCVSGVHPNVAGFHSALEPEDVDTQPKSCAIVGTTTRVGYDVGLELSALKSFRLNLSCQQCRVHKLGCDGASPSCWNCAQTYQQCCYGRTEVSSMPGNLKSPEIRAEQILEFPSWEGSLRDHPYYSLEGSKKLGRVGMWSLKLRHDLPQKAESSGSSPAVDMERSPGGDDEVLLIRGSPVPFGDGDSAFVEDETDDTSSFKSSPSTFIQSYSSSVGLPSRDSGLTIPLDLGVVSSLTLSSQPLHSSKESISTSSDDDSQSPWEKDGGSIAECVFEHAPSHNPEDFHGSSSQLFHCIFCSERFGNQEEWGQHEQTEHFDAGGDWICMPWGAIEESEDKKAICAFCGTVDPDSSHCSQHKGESCLSRSVEDRTYRSREDFQEHLRNHHNQQTITVWMESWSFPPKDDAYYWQCGFCDTLLPRWSERAIHIGNHFKTGTAMSCWNPLVPPYPISKTTGIRVPWFSSVQWDPGTFLAPELAEYNKLNSNHSASKYRQCHRCNLGFRSDGDAKRHKEVWHLPQDVWSCPTMDDVRAATYLQAGPMAWYLFQNTSLPILCEEDVCPYCGDPSDIIFEDYGEDIMECSADWEIRIKHLKHEHNMDRCQATLKFNRVDQFLLHLAGSHNVRLTDWTKDVVDSCKRQKQVPPPIKKGFLVEYNDGIA
ncbi:uncharacterized protein BP5553_02945 [Venustampulla echinocandica]|uniref:Zn(2)-C6 fungal-type domain-containing protein n=1 Tax=Venustampulla echinocandica TaxID=2656787 RepID=A0A370TSV0_9HELO|nr:uncharacterized protein BP5553_02945 [Venustampulla echinocandica]RDL38605.1 hypothetical protein BP5553_02945 [Venustampulla echinocandica]